MIACTFLVNLLGWKSTLAGLSVSIIIIPVNIYATRKYSSAQEELMKYRDQKVDVVTELLQGIRQVKFSALEQSWQNKISKIRDTELQALWTSILYDIGLMSIWILGPIMLAAVSLAAYALIYGQLTVSVAFTSIAVFGSLEMSLTAIPELTRDLVEAWISVNRIDEYLKSPDKIPVTTPAETISFKGAAIAWPADDEIVIQGRYVLRNLDLQFPPKGLSVISGQTGFGKSLLLAAVLGECDVLSGVVNVLFPPEDRYGEYASASSWIIDSSIAYVAQTP
jgi:ABC-type multidrug transport system fused ATPase/permease subunit